MNRNVFKKRRHNGYGLLETKIRRIVRQVLNEGDFISQETGEVIDENTVVYYVIKNRSGYENSWEYSYDVGRIFTASKEKANRYNKNYGGPLKTCTFKELCDICPIDPEQIYNILFSKNKELFNVYEEIKKNKKTGREYWEINVRYGHYETISTTPANDSGWYKPFTYEETNLLKRLTDMGLLTPEN